MPLTAKRARTANTPAKRISASRQYAQYAEPPQPARTAAKVRTFAPGADLAPDLEPRPLGSAGQTLERCPGCALTPWPECVCCGAPTAYALEAGGVDSAGDLEHAHALTLCAACHAVLLEVRDPRAEPLRYLPLNTLQTKRVTKRAKQPAKQAVQAKQPAQRTPRTPRTQRAKSSAKSATKGGAA